MGQQYVGVSEFLEGMFSHSVGNNDINREWAFIYCRAEFLQKWYPDSDASERYMAEQSEPLRRKITLRFYKRVQLARKWQVKNPYWRDFTLKEHGAYMSAEHFICQRYYTRAYQVLSGMYGRYCGMLPEAPVKKSGCTMLSVLSSSKDTLDRHYCKRPKAPVLSKKRF